MTEVVKRPAGGAFGQWMNANRASLQATVAAEGGKGVAAVAKKGGEVWKLMTVADKAPWQEKFREAQASYDEYKTSSSFQPLARKQERGQGSKFERRLKKEFHLRERKRAHRDLEAPKKPVGGARGLFSSEMRDEFVKAAQERGEKGVGVVGRMISEAFEALGEAERADYKDKFEKKMVAYREAMYAYTTKKREATRAAIAQAFGSPAEKRGAAQGARKITPQKGYGTEAMDAYTAEKREETRHAISQAFGSPAARSGLARGAWKISPRGVGALPVKRSRKSLKDKTKVRKTCTVCDGLGFSESGLDPCMYCSGSGEVEELPWNGFAGIWQTNGPSFRISTMDARMKFEQNVAGKIAIGILAKDGDTHSGQVFVDDQSGGFVQIQQDGNNVKLSIKTTMTDNWCPGILAKKEAIVWAKWRCNPCNGLPIQIRQEPSIDAKHASARLMPGDVFHVCCQKQFGMDSVFYLKLADGRGWVFDKIPGKGQMCEPVEEASLEEKAETQCSQETRTLQVEKDVARVVETQSALDAGA